MNGIINANVTSIANFVPSQEQMQICEDIKRGGNHAVFGEAGTGKTMLIRLVVKELSAMGRRVMCVAPTGIATLNLGIEGAMTIHRAFCLSDGKADDAVAAHCWSDIFFDTLIMDEISMVRSDIFATVDTLLRQRGNPRAAFGGVQLVVVGDFMQMPPFASDRVLESGIVGEHGSLYSFSTKAWADADFKIHKLDIVYRQQGHDDLQKYLHAIHSNSIARCELATLNDCLIANGIPGQNTPRCQLTWLKEDSRRINRECTEKCLPEWRADASVKGDYPESEFPVDRDLSLKADQKVLLVANHYVRGRPYYVNGDLGTFLTSIGNDLLVHLERNGRDVLVSRNTWYHYDYRINKDGRIEGIKTGTYTQYPVLPGYAVTITRTQGMTLSGGVHIELPFDRRLPSGVVYTALSRERSLEQLSCNRMIEPEDLCPSEEVMRFMDIHGLL